MALCASIAAALRPLPGPCRAPSSLCRARSAAFAPSLARGDLTVRARATAEAGNKGGAVQGHDSSAASKPVIRIDNKSDEFATVINIEFEEDLGDLVDLVQAIRNLGLNVVRASVDSTPGDDRAVYQFFVTDKYTSDKVLKSEMLEEIRVAIAYSLLQSVDDLEGKIMAAARPAPAEEGKPVARNKDGIATKVWIYRHVTGSRSILRVRTWDRPGVLVEIVRTLKDMSVNVISAEIDTIGNEVDDTFFVTYQGEALPPNMEILATNALQYHLGLFDVERDHSY